MKARLDAQGASPAAYRAMTNLRMFIRKESSLEPSLVELVKMREVVIADAHRFDENGNLIHEPTKQFIRELLKNLVDWTRRISPVSESAPASSTPTARHPLSGGAPA
jgi:hypothetical protein